MLFSHVQPPVVEGSGMSEYTTDRRETRFMSGIRSDSSDKYKKAKKQGPPKSNDESFKNMTLTSRRQAKASEVKERIRQTNLIHKTMIGSHLKRNEWKYK